MSATRERLGDPATSATKERLGDPTTKVIAAQRSNIAVLIPCYNEAPTIGKVVRSFKAALPGCVVYVYDNNSKDGSREIAHAAGAIVCTETLQGKGCVVRRMFADVEADVYILV